MELMNMVAQGNEESNRSEYAELQVQQLHDLELSLVGGGMGDVLQ